MKNSSLISILPQILLSHKEWFESKSGKGIFADLSEESLREGNFKSSVLVEANFQGADLRGPILKMPPGWQSPLSRYPGFHQP